MGLDSYLFKRGKNPKAKIIMSLNGSDHEQIGYWRKNWDVHSIFAEFKKDGQDDNCEEIILTKEDLKDLLRRILSEDDGYTKQVIKKAINETDWENEEVFYYAWY